MFLESVCARHSRTLTFRSKLMKQILSLSLSSWSTLALLFDLTDENI